MRSTMQRSWEAVAFGYPITAGRGTGAGGGPRSGARLNADDLRDAMEQHVGAFEVPSRILFQDSPLPRIATGKFAKRRIRAATLVALSNGR